MTVSVLALITDVVRDGKPVVGFGFNSNGRYAPSGLLRERFIPRLKAADSDSLLNDARDNLDPGRVRDVLMRNEKPGGHGLPAFWRIADGIPVENSYVKLPDIRGIGFEAKNELFRTMKALLQN
jgi:hypothetical protein